MKQRESGCWLRTTQPFGKAIIRLTGNNQGVFPVAITPRENSSPGTERGDQRNGPVAMRVILFRVAARRVIFASQRVLPAIRANAEPGL